MFISNSISNTGTALTCQYTCQHTLIMTQLIILTANWTTIRYLTDRQCPTPIPTLPRRLVKFDRCYNPQTTILITILLPIHISTAWLNQYKPTTPITTPTWVTITVIVITIVIGIDMSMNHHNPTETKRHRIS